jgi:putative transposase
MDKTGSLNHTKWECKYHIVFIPKGRRKVLYGQLKKQLPEVFHDLAGHKESRIEEGHMMDDHVHMLISIPPKYAVSQVVGYIKGKKCDVLGQGIRREEKKLCRAKFLGEGLLCIDGGTRRRSHPQLHPAPRAGR